MNVQVNGESREIDGSATVADLLASLDIRPRTVAVERNGEIVPRARYGETGLAEGDAIEIVTFVGGG